MLLRKDSKGVYPYEYIDSSERYDEIASPDKEFFYSELYLKDVAIKTTHMLRKYLKKQG